MRLPDIAYWESDWPKLARRLEAIVARRLPCGAEACDVTQHVAEALAGRSAGFESHDHIARYATAVAFNYVKRLYRDRSREFAAVPDPQAPSRDDVERAVLHRMRLDCLAGLVSDLSEAERRSFGDPGSASDREPAARTRRSRLRRALRARMDKKIGGAIFVPRLRWLWGPVAAGTVALSAAIPLIPLFEPPPAPPPRTSDSRGLPESGFSASEQPAVALPPSVVPVSVASAPTQSPRDAGYRQVAEVRGAGGVGAEAGTRNLPPDAGPQPLLCLSGTDPLPPPCVPHPHPIREEALKAGSE